MTYQNLSIETSIPFFAPDDMLLKASKPRASLSAIGVSDEKAQPHNDAD
jgi:hypothetical protein